MATDVTRFDFSWGKCYWSPILDMATNEIVSDDLSLHTALRKIHHMLKRAFGKFPHVSRLMLHSDQGWQYQHACFGNELKKWRD